MITALNVIAALLTIGFGLFGFLAPAYTANALDLTPTKSTMGFSEMRASVGGLFVVTGAVVLWLNTPMAYAKPYLFELGQIHAEHETTSEQYDLFATSLIEVLSSPDLLSKHGSAEAAELSSPYTVAESKEAWSKILEIIKVTMLDGAKSF